MVAVDEPRPRPNPGAEADQGTGHREPILDQGTRQSKGDMVRTQRQGRVFDLWTSRPRGSSSFSPKQVPHEKGALDDYGVRFNTVA